DHQLHRAFLERTWILSSYNRHGKSLILERSSHMKHFRSFRLWAIVIFLLCISTLASFACKTGRSSEEQSVYETVVKHHLSKFHSNQPKFLVIRENTAKNIQSVDDYWEYL